MSLSTRNLVPELMDDPSLDPQEHQRALAALRRINVLSRTASNLAKQIGHLARAKRLRSLSVLDVGCGSGDVVSAVQQNLSRDFHCEATGWDISRTATATANARSKGRVNFETVDAFNISDYDSRRFDFVYCSLFLHHFSDDQTLVLLKRFRSLARHAVLVDDLVRSATGLFYAHVACQVLTRSPIVHFDGPQSVRAAFTIDEASRLANQCGFASIRVQNHWPSRFMLVGEIASE